MTRNRQDAVEALDIAAHGKVKCQYEIREFDQVNRYVARNIDSQKSL